MYWATVNPSCFFFFFLHRNIPLNVLRMMLYFISRSTCTFICMYSIFRTILHRGCMKNQVGYFFSPFVSLSFISDTSVEVNLVFLFLVFLLAVGLRKCKPARDELVFMLLLPAYHSLSHREPKTKDLCTLVRAIVSFRWLAACGPRNWTLCFLCSFTSCLFLYSTGFILLMHFDDEESLPQATLNLSVQDCYDITC